MLRYKRINIANTLQRPENTVYEETDSYYQEEEKYKAH